MPDRPVAEYPIDEDLVRSLLQAQAEGVVRDAATVRLRRVAAGWDNEIWRVGHDHAMRLPRRALAAPLVLHEHRALPVLAPALGAVGVGVPMAVVHGAPAMGYPWAWSLVPWFEGRRAMDVRRSERSGWAPILARAVLALHSSAPADAPANPYRGRPLATRDADVRVRIDALIASGRLSPSLADATRAVWSAGVEAPIWAEPAVWLHGDLHPGNILVRDGSLAALLDFGDVTSGDPAYDLAAAWLAFDSVGGARFRSALAGRYDAAAHTRARAWAAAVCVMLITFSDDNPDYASLGVEALDEVLAQPG